MRDFHRRSVVMLDHLVDRHAPHSWPVSVVRDTEEEAREVGQYAGDAPTLVPRAEYAATATTAVSLVNARTGETLPAHVYRMERRAGG